MTPIPLAGTLVESTPIDLVVLVLAVAITAAWLHFIYN
jgi:hypothetical protein